jgi:hypothetical protein
MERRTVEEGIARPEQARELAIQRLKMKQDFKGIAAGGSLLVVVCFLIWLFGDVGLPWPFWVVLGVAVVLVIQGYKAYVPSNRITEDEVERETKIVAAGLNGNAGAPHVDAPGAEGNALGPQ